MKSIEAFKSYINSQPYSNLNYPNYDLINWINTVNEGKQLIDIIQQIENGYTLSCDISALSFQSRFKEFP